MLSFYYDVLSIWEDIEAAICEMEFELPYLFPKPCPWVEPIRFVVYLTFILKPFLKLVYSCEKPSIMLWMSPESG